MYKKLEQEKENREDIEKKTIKKYFNEEFKKESSWIFDLQDVYNAYYTIKQKWQREHPDQQFELDDEKKNKFKII